VHVFNGVELPYRLFVPTDYDPTKSYPLVLYLHHAGLAGSDGNNETGWDNCVHLTSEIGSGDDYGGVFTHSAVDEDGTKFQTQERYPHFVLAPHAESPAYGFGGGVAGSATAPEHKTRPVLEDILKTVQAEFSIDPGRLYVTGISMGCYGTWDIIMRKPGVFAAASPQSCRGDPNEELLAKIKDMPIWSMCGTNDSYFAGAQAMADGMKNVGATDATFTFTAMQGVGHSINDRGYDYPGFIDWMFAQRSPGTMPPGSGGAGGAGGSGGGASGSAGTAGGSAGSTVQAGQPTGGAGVGGASASGSSAGGQSGAAPEAAGTSSIGNAPTSESSCSLASSPVSRAPLALAVALSFAAAAWRRRSERCARRG
jgi:dienelactone hydrolase